MAPIGQMNFITIQLFLIVSYVMVMDKNTIHRWHKVSHFTIHPLSSAIDSLRRKGTLPSAPPAPLGDGRINNAQFGETPVEVCHVVLHRCDELNGLALTQVVPATVNQDDVRRESFGKNPIQNAGLNRIPPHSTHAKPLNLGLHAEVKAQGPHRSLLCTTNVAAPNY